MSERGKNTALHEARRQARLRAQELVGKMTVEERASQLRFDAPAIERLGVPAYNWWNEALHGVARAGTATVFPQAIGLAAAFDEALMEQIGDCIAVEGRAKYNEQSRRGDRDIYKGLTFWSPNVNIFRDPRWGRGHETYGEDSYLTGRLGVRYIEGMQGRGPVMKAAACAKHFAVHSGPEGLRHEFDAQATPKDMEETYLPAFEACVREAGVEAVMGAYNRTNGEPCCASRALIGHFLRGKWGFEGHFVSDCWAVRDFHEHHKVTSGPEESVQLALKAGCDLNCGCTYRNIMNAYREGLVDEAEITESCVRLFTTRFLLGLFDDTAFDSIPYTEVESPAHLALAARAARESLVLLKNNGVLPLRKERLKTIGVIGPNADSRRALEGNYHGTSSRYITVLEGIQDAVGDGVRVLYSQGCDLFRDKVESLSQPGCVDRLAEAEAVAAYSDVVVLVLGLDETLEGEEGDTGNSYASGDKVNLSLPSSQLALMKTVLGCSKPVVLVNMTGSAMDLRLADEKADAILQAWYPGGRGGAQVAEVLFGEASPSGKLPVTFYRDAEDLPEFTDYSMKNRTYRYFEGTPLYPFGYGLTYGDCAVTALSMTPCFRAAEEPAAEGICREDTLRTASAPVQLGNEVGAAEQEEDGGSRADAGGKALFDGVQVEVTAENRGAVDTEEVLQVYVKDEDSAFAVPHPCLSAFARVSLKAGERRHFSLRLERRAFTSVDEEGCRELFGARFSVYAGFSQPDARSQALTGHACAQAQLQL